MAGVGLEQMVVNAGDPITAELMQNIITNISSINNLSNSTTVDPATGTVVQQVIDSGRDKVACKTDSTGTATIKFKKTFKSAPNIPCSLWNPSSANLVKLKYMPIITSFTATEFTISMLSLGATGGGNLYVTWTAVQ